MGDFLGLIVIIAMVLLSASGKNKKKQSKRAKAGAGRGRQSSPAAGKRTERHAARSAAASAAVFAQQACEGEPIHLHDPSQEQMYFAQEGEDPCHAGGAVRADADEQDAAWSEADEAHEALRQDVLRGVVMSEILTRPCERRNRRRAY